MEMQIKEGYNFLNYPFGRSALREAKPKPPKAIARELDFVSTDVNTFRLFYSRYTKDIPVADDAALKDLVILIHNDRFTGWENPPPPPPPVQSAPFDSELSIYNNELKYIIFLLKQGRNWQFARKHWPITIGDKYKEYFYDAARADASGIPDFGDDEEFIRDDCRVAYVMAAADEILKTTGAYRHAINLHIDLINTVTGKAGTGTITKKCYLPLIIDPDIRFPGGSGEP